MSGVAYRTGQEIPGTVYRVVQHLATGGMGSVYEVEDTTVEKRYVLKTLHPQLLARQDLAQKMKEEARALAKLHHPNIVDVVTAGVTTDEARVPYYLMERLNGQTLRYVLEKKGALDLVYALRVAIDVLDALEHAHEHGIIHRDVKPENIFLHRNASGTTTTKLLDFGIMRLVDHKTTSFKKGTFVGTIRYAAPEQILGEDVGPSCDVYALGIVLYEMIAGRGPFDEIDEGYAIGMAHVQKAPPPVSKFVMNVPAEIERLVMSSIAKRPNERPPDAFTFAEELRRLMPGGPLSPRAPRVLTPVSGPALGPALAPALGATPASRVPSSGSRSTPIAFEPTVTPTPARAPTPPMTSISSMSSTPSSPSMPSMPGGSGTRSAEVRNVVLPIALATIFAVTVLAGAVLYVVHPWRSDASAGASASASASAAASAAPPPADSTMPAPAKATAPPSASASASGSASASAGSASAASASAAPSAPVGRPGPAGTARPASPPAKPSSAVKGPPRPEDVGFE